MRRIRETFSAQHAAVMKYIHELTVWPRFAWDYERVAILLGSVRDSQGRLIGRMETLGFASKTEATLQALTLDVIKSSEIEGVILDPDQVRSSIARRLGLDVAGLVPSDRDIDGVVDMMLDAARNSGKALSKERLFGWHACLFPSGRSGMGRICVGAWRNDRSGPMRVVSGAMGREKVHYEAPAADRVELEMKRFLLWFNSAVEMDPVLKAGLAHLWFVTIHPFDDGNGRIARAIADMQLARADGIERRYYSMSVQIRKERRAYYDVLERTQKSCRVTRGAIDITEWIEWFLSCFGRSIGATEETLAGVFKKALFWESISAQALNERQRIMVNRLLDGFGGKLTSSKWARIAKCSQDTALRDILLLVEKNVLAKDRAGGRSTSYSLRPVASETGYSEF